METTETKFETVDIKGTTYQIIRSVKTEDLDRWFIDAAKEAGETSRHCLLSDGKFYISKVIDGDFTDPVTYDLELKNVKHRAFASHETYCFEASLYVNGKRSFHVHNDGKGGCNWGDPYDGVTLKVGDIDEWLRILPTREVWGRELESTFDYKISCMVSRHLMEKQVKRDMKKGIVFGYPEKMKESGGYTYIKFEKEIMKEKLFFVVNEPRILRQYPGVIFAHKDLDAFVDLLETE